MADNSAMRVSMTEARTKLYELVRSAEAGEVFVLTRRGQPIVRIVPASRKPTPEETMAAIKAIQMRAAKKAKWKI